MNTAIGESTRLLKGFSKGGGSSHSSSKASNSAHHSSSSSFWWLYSSNKDKEDGEASQRSVLATVITVAVLLIIIGCIVYCIIEAYKFWNEQENAKKKRKHRKRIQQEALSLQANIFVESQLQDIMMSSSGSLEGSDYDK